MGPLRIDGPPPQRPQALLVHVGRAAQLRQLRVEVEQRHHASLGARQAQEDQQRLWGGGGRGERGWISGTLLMAPCFRASQKKTSQTNGTETVAASLWPYQVDNLLNRPPGCFWAVLKWGGEPQNKISCFCKWGNFKKDHM